MTDSLSRQSAAAKLKALWREKVHFRVPSAEAPMHAPVPRGKGVINLPTNVAADFDPREFMGGLPPVERHCPHCGRAL